jgi:hypothetical protein
MFSDGLKHICRLCWQFIIDVSDYQHTSPLSGLEIPSEVQDEDPIHFPLRLKNSTSIYQDTISYLMQSGQEIPLTGAQMGLVLYITPEGGIVHWPGAWPNTSSIEPSRLVAMVELLPYQDGRTLPADGNDHGSTEILDSTTTIESGTHWATRHSREVFMTTQPPQIPMPNPLDIQDGEETLSNISLDTPAPNRETNE